MHTLVKKQNNLIWNQSPEKKKKTKRKKQQTKVVKKGEVSWNWVKSVLDGLGKLALIVAIGYGLYHGYLFFTTSPKFNIAKVIFSGNEVIEKRTLDNWAQPISGQNIFKLDLPSITDSLSKNPWVRNVIVVRKFPQTIHIAIQERQPYALIKLDKIYLMDNYGVLIAPAEKNHNKLPLITGANINSFNFGEPLAIEGMTEGLNAMHHLNRMDIFRNDPIDRLEFKGLNNLVFQSRFEKIKLHISVDRIQEGFNNLKTIFRVAQPTLKGIQYIDLSFKDKVVIKRVDDVGSIHKTRNL